MFQHVEESEILVRMRGNAPQGTKLHFPCPARACSKVFQNNSHDSNLGRSSDECMTIPMLKPTAQRQKLALISRTRKMLVFMRSRHLVTWSTSMQMSTIFFILCWPLALLTKAYWSCGKVVFHYVLLL